MLKDTDTIPSEEMLSQSKPKLESTKPTDRVSSSSTEHALNKAGTTTYVRQICRGIAPSRGDDERVVRVIGDRLWMGGQRAVPAGLSAHSREMKGSGGNSGGDGNDERRGDGDGDGDEGEVTGAHAVTAAERIWLRYCANRPSEQERMENLRWRIIAMDLKKQREGR